MQYKVAKAKIAPGTYRKITGNEALALGLVAAAKQANKTLVYSGYPITPASSVLEQLAEMRRFGVKTLQAEDEIAAVGVAIGASFGGAIGVTGTSGPGICLKSEAIGLAVMTELPLVILDIQRGGPSTGLPTKTEQADLLQVMFGRNGECPAAIIAPQSPTDCFDMAFEAVRIATRFMCPVFVLSDGYLANGSEPWQIPDPAALPKIEIKHPTEPNARRVGRLRPRERRGRGRRGRQVPAVQAGRPAGPAVGDPRHPGPGAPHRRDREAGRDREHQLRAGQPRAHGQDPGEEDRGHRPRRSPTWRSRGRPTRNCW